jgi:hypothetical protein
VGEDPGDMLGVGAQAVIERALELRPKDQVRARPEGDERCRQERRVDERKACPE